MDRTPRIMTSVNDFGDQIAERLEAVTERLRSAGRDDVKIVAVSKTFPAEAIVAAATRCGIVDFGESYAQEFVTKHAAVHELLDELPATNEALGSGAVEPCRWHFVGGLQRNKVRKVAHLVDLWHSVDRASLAREIAKHSPGARVLLQVDISGEDTKKGCAPAELESLLTASADAGLSVVGLMGMAPLAEPEAARPGFRLLRELAATYGLAELSMGMSGDLEVAAQEGATMVRVGSSLFGPRS